MNSEYLGDGMVRLGTGEIVPALRPSYGRAPQGGTVRIACHDDHDHTIYRLKANISGLAERIDDLERHRRILAWLLVLALAALAGCVSGILS